jgi:Interferon-induced transmembrane protein
MEQGHYRQSNDIQEYSHSGAPIYFYTVAENTPSSVTEVRRSNRDAASFDVEEESETIRDYLPWSILNVFLGVFILGIIAIVCSMQVPTSLRSNNFLEARIGSTRALICNIIATIGGLSIWAVAIYFIVVSVQTKN